MYYCYNMKLTDNSICGYILRKVCKMPRTENMNAFGWKGETGLNYIY